MSYNKDIDLSVINKNHYCYENGRPVETYRCVVDEDERGKNNIFSENSVDNLEESDIINTEISIKLDRFTPCLIERKTGIIFETTVNKAELSDMPQRGSWNLDWKKQYKEKDYSVYKLTLKTIHKI